MSILSNRLKQLREEKEVMQKEIAAYLNISASAYGFYEQGKRTPTPEILSKLANYFNVSVDYLLGRDINLKNGSTIELTDKDRKDIEKTLNKTMDMLESQEGLMLSGNPVDDEDWELLKAAIQNGLEYAKKMNKAKYTPKKYRK